MTANFTPPPPRKPDLDQPGEPQRLLNESWEQRYQSGNTGWDRQQTSPALLRWLAQGQVPEGRVLVPGCGTGHEVLEFAASGRDVTAVDLAPSALNTLRQRLAAAGLQATLVETDLLDWQPDRRFDAIYEQTSLCAIDPSCWHKYVKQLHAWLKSDGTLLAAFMQTGREGGPPFDCPMARMQQLFDGEHWNPINTQFQVDHPSGLYEICAILRKR